MEEVCNVKRETVADATDVNTFLCQPAGLCVCVCVCVHLCLLTEGLHSDDFIFAQALASLVVCKPPWVEKPALDTLPEAEESEINGKAKYAQIF